MRHVRFVLLLIAALVIAFPTAIVWAMNECQLHRLQADADACFRSADGRCMRGYAALAIAVVSAVALHVTSSKWTWVALVAVAVGPMLAVVLVGLAF